MQQFWLVASGDPWTVTCRPVRTDIPAAAGDAQARPLQGIIDARLEEIPTLPAKRLFDEVRAAGYPGCYEGVRNYVRAAGPRRAIRADGPLRDARRQAGGQVGFGTFALPWGRRHALVVVLEYSRLLWPSFYPGQTMAVLMDGLERAFEGFGGVPEELLFGQMRAVVLSEDRHTPKHASRLKLTEIEIGAPQCQCPSSCIGTRDTLNAEVAVR